jgi:hypothetical protein
LPTMADQLIPTSATPADRLPREFAGSPRASGQTFKSTLACKIEDKEQHHEDK